MKKIKKFLAVMSANAMILNATAVTVLAKEPEKYSPYSIGVCDAVTGKVIDPEYIRSLISEFNRQNNIDRGDLWASHTDTKYDDDLECFIVVVRIGYDHPEYEQMIRELVEKENIDEECVEYVHLAKGEYADQWLREHPVEKNEPVPSVDDDTIMELEQIRQQIVQYVNESSLEVMTEIDKRVGFGKIDVTPVYEYAYDLSYKSIWENQIKPVLEQFLDESGIDTEKVYLYDYEWLEELYPETSAPSVSKKNAVLGDANSDGVANARDAAYIAKMLAYNMADKLPSNSDFDKNGKIDVRDTAKLTNTLATKNL